jgi:hypothetical protein
MAEVITTVEDVKVVAEGNKNGRDWTKSAVIAGDGREYATFDGELASEAKSLTGQTVKITFTESQRGKYTNYDLTDIEAAEGATPVAANSNGNSGSRSGEFRSKYEIRYSVALEQAITAFGVSGVDVITKVPELYELADEFFERLGQIDAEVAAA